MRENIKVRNDNKYYVGLDCSNWTKKKQVKPSSFAYLTDNDILELDSNYEFFSSGELVVEDEELNIKMGYSEVNPNTLTEKQLTEIFKLSAGDIKEKLSGVTEMFALAKITEVAKKSDLSVTRLKVIEAIVGKKIELDDITPIEVEEVKKAASKSKSTKVK
ncbi:hypothetical protein [Clostridium estertheticum]|uniref:hypothetical protein n=1 Tax=Clostridium estertheticum TaxID=238834 RepID=UPI001C0E7407|nr:hypothetical protein [Clostridium estertheticum]MBU3186649.1 hypothetical protein [Clostridium estertheticum]